MSLRTDYKDDMFAGKRKYRVTQNDDGTISLDDVTIYTQQGDVFSSGDINTTNAEVNKNSRGLIEERKQTNNQINTLSSNVNASISNTNNRITNLDNELTEINNVTFLSGNWTPSAPYTQRVNVSGIKETDNPIPGLIYPANMTETQKENIDKSSDMITELETFNGYIKATCKFKKPIADITIGLKGR